MFLVRTAFQNAQETRLETVQSGVIHRLETVGDRPTKAVVLNSLREGEPLGEFKLHAPMSTVRAGLEVQVVTTTGGIVLLDAHHQKIIGAPSRNS